METMNPDDKEKLKRVLDLAHKFLAEKVDRLEAERRTILDESRREAAVLERRFDDATRAAAEAVSADPRGRAALEKCLKIVTGNLDRIRLFMTKPAIRAAEDRFAIRRPIEDEIPAVHVSFNVALSPATPREFAAERIAEEVLKAIER